MQLDNGNSQASLARVHFKPHNQPYIVATSSHSDCKANETVDRLASTKSHVPFGGSALSNMAVSGKPFCFTSCSSKVVGIAL